MSNELKGITGFQEEETTGVSPWLLSLLDELGEERPTPHWSYSFQGISFEVIEGKQSLWLIGYLARPVYCSPSRNAMTWSMYRSVRIGRSSDVLEWNRGGKAADLSIA